jgi:hypothetical protein
MEQLFLHLGRKAGTGIADADLDRPGCGVLLICINVAAALSR